MSLFKKIFNTTHGTQIIEPQSTPGIIHEDHRDFQFRGYIILLCVPFLL